MLNTEGFSWVSFARTDVGKVRKVNEDSMLDHAPAGVWVVADGMGGHAAGDVASSSIVSNLSKLKPSADADSLVSEIEQRLLDTNNDLLRQSEEREDRQTMGSTVVVLLAFGKKIFCLWAGDSRLYRLRDGILSQITIDHSKVQELVDEGLITEDEAEKHPDANVITRAIGANQRLFIDMDMHDARLGDRYLLCSDGLFKEVMKHEIHELLGQGAPEEACNTLIELTLERGSRDNVTVIVVEAN